MVVFEWHPDEENDRNSDGLLYWYLNEEEARDQFPECEIMKVEMIFPGSINLN